MDDETIYINLVNQITKAPKKAKPRPGAALEMVNGPIFMAHDLRGVVI
jgi:hypothetical protein